MDSDDRSQREDLSDFGTNEPLVTEESRQEYIKQLLSIIADDMKNVMVMATVSTLVAAYLAKDLLTVVQHHQLCVRIAAFVTIVLLLTGAGLLFAYSASVEPFNPTEAAVLMAGTPRAGVMGCDRGRFWGADAV